MEALVGIDDSIKIEKVFVQAVQFAHDQAMIADAEGRFLKLIGKTN